MSVTVNQELVTKYRAALERIGKKWNDMLPAERDGVIAELFDLQIPPGAIRPFRIVEEQAFWNLEEGGFKPVPRFTQTWASTMKLVTGWQSDWWKGPHPHMWEFKATPTGEWRVSIRKSRSVGDPLYIVSDVGEGLPRIVCEVALQFIGVPGGELSCLT